jgi:predicted phosphodiesterase
MIQFQLASDLHLENNNITTFSDIIIPSAPYLLLAGDIGSPLLPSYKNFLLDACNFFEKIIFIAGNHEYYSPYKCTMDQIKNIIKDICAEFQNDKLIFLDNDYYIINDIRIIGSTLWSHCPNKNLQENHADCRSIWIDNGLINVDDTNLLHSKSVEFIHKQILLAKKFDQKILIMTHHAPIKEKVSHPMYNNDPYSCFFSTDLSYLVDKKLVDVWIFGHTHYNISYTINACQLFSNQLGNFSNLNSFNKQFIIRL